MTKGELVQRLARQFPGIRREDARVMIDLFLDSMKEGLRSGDTVELRDFGVLRVRTRATRKARNPRTGSSVLVAPKKVPYFKQSRILKSSLKSSQVKG
ncbi:MAG: integration host factor subunit beta [Nitrospiraceae bacterium]|jgi:integration host factor subunit beta|nr:integration host factor subunit beta [Nitrospiraceae bacterium]MDA8112571.1 integration host factor subunit beta [Nitrospiraceae bacterium]